MTPGERAKGVPPANRLPDGAHDPWLDLLPPDAGGWAPAHAAEEPAEPPGPEPGHTRIPQVPDPFPAIVAPLDHDHAGEAVRLHPRLDRAPGRLVRPYMVSGG